MLHTQEPHLPRVRDAGAESVRLPKTEQVPAPPSQIYPANNSPGTVKSSTALLSIV